MAKKTTPSKPAAKAKPAKATPAKATPAKTAPAQTPQALGVTFSPEASAAVADALNNLLANYHIYYMNLRGFHWNVRGQHFFTLHQQFELYYTSAGLFIDELAERILTLGRTPLHSFPRFLEAAVLPVTENVTDGRAAVQALLQQTNTLAGLVREALEVADSEDDDGTEDILTTKLGELEKRAWMLAAYLG